MLIWKTMPPSTADADTGWAWGEMAFASLDFVLLGVFCI